MDATHTRGGGVGWDVNVHVTLRQDVNVHVNGTSFTNLIQVCAVPEAGTRMMMMMMMTMMMMMIMTLMKLVNSATKFRHGMDKFYQPNSGLRGSRSGDEAIYT